MKKRLISILLAVCMVMSLLAVSAGAASEVSSGQCGDNVYYSLDSDGTLTVSGEGAVWDYPGITDEVGYDAITEVIIEEGVTVLGDESFYACGNLVTVSIAASVEIIGYDCFSECTSLETVTIAEGSSLTEIDGYAFMYDSSLKSINLPASLEYISYYAFYYCSSLADLGMTLEELWEQADVDTTAFYCCPGLADEDGFVIAGDVLLGIYTDAAEVTIPDSITTLVGWVDEVEVINIGANVETIEEYFFLTGALTAINVDANNPYYTSIDGVLFTKDMTTLVAYPEEKEGSSYTVPDGVETISSYAFYGNSNLETVTIPDSAAQIGGWAFGWCSSLTDIIVPEDAELGTCAFVSCPGLADEDGFVIVNDVIFGYYGDETDVVIPDTVTEISMHAFNGNVSSTLTSVVIPDSVTGIGPYAFAFQDELTSAVIGDSVIDIGYCAFYYCTSLSEVTLGSSLEYIGGWCFEGTVLTSITIPASVTYIDEGAFWYCETLEEVIFESDATEYAENAFEGVECMTPGTLYISWLCWNDEGEVYFDLDEGGWTDRWGALYPNRESDVVFFVADTDEDGNLIEDTITFVDPTEIEMSWVFDWNTYGELDDYTAVNSEDEAYFVHVWGADESAWYQGCTFTWYDADGRSYVMEGECFLNTPEWYTGTDFGNYEEYASEQTGYNILSVSEGNDSGTYIYLARYDDGSDDEMELYLADDEGNALFSIAADGSIYYAYDGGEPDEYWVEYYETWFEFEWVTGDSGGEGLKISLTDEAIASAFEGDVWVAVRWINGHDVWDGGVWNWYFYPTSAVVWSEADLFPDYTESDILPYAEYADSVSGTLTLTEGETVTGYFYRVRYAAGLGYTYVDEDGNEQVAYVDAEDGWYIIRNNGEELWYVFDDPNEDSALTVVTGAYDCAAVTAEEAGVYEIDIGYPSDDGSVTYGWANPLTVIVESAFTFTDDTGTGAWSWASDYIYACYEQGIITGYADGDGYSFLPSNNLTRAEAATIIARAYGLTFDADAEYTVFSDDDGTGAWSWADEYIYACVQAGIINGYSDGTFLPSNNVTRVELAKMIAAAEELALDAVESSFSDVADTHWGLRYIEACVEAGIVNGYTDGTFLPANNVTRAEAAAMIARALGLAE